MQFSEKERVDIFFLIEENTIALNLLVLDKRRTYVTRAQEETTFI